MVVYNIVKSLIFYQKMIHFELEFPKLFLISDGCFVLNLIPYCIILQQDSAPFDNCLGFILDIHMQICVPPNSVLVCGLVLIFLCGLLSVSDDTNYMYS